MAADIELNGSPRGVRLAQMPITITAPGWRGHVRLVDLAAGDARSAAAARSDALPEQAFGEAHIDTVARFEIDARAPAARSTRTRAADSALRVTLDSPRPDRDYAVLQLDPCRWTVQPVRTAEGKLEFALPTPTAAPRAGPADRRGTIVGAMKIAARIVSWAAAGVTGRLAREIAGSWEARRRPYLLCGVGHDGAATEPDWSKLASRRTLLLVHGTFSTPFAAFSGLFRTEEFDRILDHYAQRCLAFAHPSMSEDIDANIEQLQKTIPQGVDLDVDIVSHSRGGLISRALVAACASGQLPHRVRRLAMVAAPNRGTPLADSRNWLNFIDRHTNLLVSAPDTVSTVVLEGVLCLVKIVGSGALRGLPGLAAMEPSGEAIATLKSAPIGQSELHSIVADYSPSAGTPLATLVATAADAAVDSFFGEANDIVVPTEGGHDLNDSAQGFPLPLSRVHRFKGGAINHTTFFEAQCVRATLEALLMPDAR